MSERVLWEHGEWWGSPIAVVRCERPKDLPHEIRVTNKIGQAVKQVLSLKGKPATIGQESKQIGGGVIAVPLTSRSGQMLNLDYLRWIKKFVDPDRWTQVVMKGGEAVWVVGWRDGEDEPVAMIGAINPPTP